MNRGTLRPYAVQVAVALTKLTDVQWLVVPQKSDEDWYWIVKLQCGVDDANKTLTLISREADKTIEVIGGYVHEGSSQYKGDNPPSSVNGSPTKSPEAFAKDINRRLIDAWMVSYEEGRQRWLSHKAFDEAKLKLAEELRHKFHGYSTSNDNCEFNISTLGPTIGVKVNSPTSVEIVSFSSDPECMTEVLKSLTSIWPPTACKVCGSGLNGRSYCSDKDCLYNSVAQDAVIVKVKATEIRPNFLVHAEATDKYFDEKVRKGFWFVAQVKAEGDKVVVDTMHRSYGDPQDPVLTFGKDEVLYIVRR